MYESSVLPARQKLGYFSPFISQPLLHKASLMNSICAHLEPVGVKYSENNCLVNKTCIYLRFKDEHVLFCSPGLFLDRWVQLVLVPAVGCPPG